jgi:hypothetical protein
MLRVSPRSSRVVSFLCGPPQVPSKALVKYAPAIKVSPTLSLAANDAQLLYAAPRHSGWITSGSPQTFVSRRSPSGCFSWPGRWRGGLATCCDFLYSAPSDAECFCMQHQVMYGRVLSQVTLRLLQLAGAVAREFSDVL